MNNKKYKNLPITNPNSPAADHQLLITALVAAKEAGDAILEVYDSDFAVETKDDRSPLTLADKRSHEIITHRLSQQRMTMNNNKYTINKRSLPLLSEEGKDIPYNERKNWEYFWLIDPLDGTKEFIKRNGEFTVNIALIHQGKPVLGVIYIPVKDIFYFAAKPLGSYKLPNSDAVTGDVLFEELVKNSMKLPVPHNNNNYTINNNASSINNSVPIINNNELTANNTVSSVNNNASPEGSKITIIGSRSHPSPELSEFVDRMEKQYDSVHFISAGSSLKFCLVAEGTADIYPRYGPTMEWDTAAGQCIVEEAGGSVTRIDTGVTLLYNKENLLNPWFEVTL